MHPESPLNGGGTAAELQWQSLQVRSSDRQRCSTPGIWVRSFACSQCNRLAVQMGARYEYTFALELLYKAEALTRGTDMKHTFASRARRLQLRSLTFNNLGYASWRCRHTACLRVVFCSGLFRCVAAPNVHMQFACTICTLRISTANLHVQVASAMHMYHLRIQFTHRRIAHKQNQGFCTNYALNSHTQCTCTIFALEFVRLQPTFHSPN